MSLWRDLLGNSLMGGGVTSSCRRSASLRGLGRPAMLRAGLFERTGLKLATGDSVSASRARSHQFRHRVNPYARGPFQLQLARILQRP